MKDPWNGNYARKLQDLEFYFSASPTRCVVTRTMEKCLFDAPSTSRSERIRQVQTPKSTKSPIPNNTNQKQDEKLENVVDDNKSVISVKTNVSTVSTISKKSHISRKTNCSKKSNVSENSHSCKYCCRGVICKKYDLKNCLVNVSF